MVCTQKWEKHMEKHIIEEPTKKNRKKRAKFGAASLRITILATFTTVFVTAVLFIVIYGHMRSMSSLRDSGRELVSQTAKTVLAKTLRFLESPRNTAQNGALMLTDKTLDFKSDKQMRHWFVSAITTNPKIVMLYFTHRSGYHVGVEHKDNKWFYWKINKENGKRTLIKTLLGKGLLPLTSEKKTDFGFDPHKRDWYFQPKHTGKPFWSHVYGFFSSATNQVGITISYPVFDDKGVFAGVLGADIDIKAVSTFLATVTVGKSGLAVITDSRGRVIAHPDFAQVVAKSQVGKAVINPITHVTPSWLGSGYKALGDKVNKSLLHKTGGEQYLFARHAFPESFGVPWVVIVGAKDDDFIGSAKKTNRNNLIIAFAVLLLGVLFILHISNSISKPLAQLTEETNKVRNFDLDGSVDAHSKIQEIRELNESIGAMKHSLRAFKKYVPSELVRTLLKTEQKVEIGGHQKELTIFFSDIQGFTSISEEVDPQFLMTHLSEYLEELTSILIAHDATIDKYIGDAIMAFWNAPLDTPDHPVLACEAALKCQARLRELNAQWKSQGKPELITRMGIQTGTAVVGNIGSSERMNYTILGDNVNLAARLEGINKMYGTHLLISEATNKRLNNRFLTRPLDIVRVKGKEKPVKIFELLDICTESTDANCKLRVDVVTKAFDCYIKRDWDGAIEHLGGLIKNQNDSAAYDFMRRCRQFQQSPPPKDWEKTGTVMTSK
jgi:adenylate cyclase